MNSMFFTPFTIFLQCKFFCCCFFILCCVIVTSCTFLTTKVNCFSHYYLL